MRNKEELFDFRAMGKAIKAARTNKKLTRDNVANIIHIDQRYLTNIENKGQHPGFQTLYNLVTLFDVSVDEFFFPDVKPRKNTKRRQVDNLLNKLDDKELIIVESTINGILKSKETEEE